MNINKTIYLLFFGLLFQLAHAQMDTSFIHTNINYDEYMKTVSSNNLGYAAEKFNIDMSDAKIEMAKVFQDPSFAFDLNKQSEEGLNTSYSIVPELSKSVNFSGKRNARIDLAKSEQELTKNMVEDYFRNLRAEATLVYLEALKQDRLFRVKIDSYNTMKQLSIADSIRFTMGNITEIDAIQSKVEAGILFNELLQTEAEWKNSLNQLPLMMGISASESTILPKGNFEDAVKLFNLNDLIQTAINNRSDLLAALKGREVSQKALQLTKRERGTDVDVKVSFENFYSHTDGSQIAREVTAGVAIPLKFSNFNKGEIKLAQYQVSQADKVYEQVKIEVKSEIVQALNLYNASCRQVESFDKGLLDSANDVKKGKIYSYERGETSLLEVLNAQRTYNDIQTAYYEALYNRAAALVELEKAAGIWDISL